MKRILIALTACLLGVAVASAQESKPAKAKQDRVSGTVQNMDKDGKVLTLRRGNISRQVVYSDTTQWTKQNKPGGTLDEIKEGTRLICIGTFDQKTRLEATRCDIRLPK